MVKPNKIFKKTAKDYLAQINEIDFTDKAEILQIDCSGPNILLSFFNHTVEISSENIQYADKGKIDFAPQVAIFKYLLLCPHYLPKEIAMASFKDFKDTAPLINFFNHDAEGRIASHFSGRIEDLRKAAIKIGGQTLDAELNYDLLFKFMALPRIPLFLLFNNQEENFKATCKILFEKRAEKFLDGESLAVAGALLANYLVENTEI
jgi:hypothetical protein